MIVTIETRTGAIAARVWKLAVGRNTLLLLDSDVEGNRPEDRELTARLYGGDDAMRIRQELLLGVGGVRALKALGITPGVAHLNEGHSAFAALELVRDRMGPRASALDEAIRRVVAADRLHDAHAGAGRPRSLPPELIEEHLGPLRDALGLSATTSCMALGRVNPPITDETFCMTVLALKLSRRANAVSSLHGQVSRAMWAPPLSRALPRKKCRSATSPTACTCRPGWRRRCTSSTTGISGPTGRARCGEPACWDDDRRRRRRRALGDAPGAQGAADRLRAAARGRAAPSAAASRPSSSRSCGTSLSLDALTIGFARRFATYKRADLSSRTSSASRRWSTTRRRPMQFVFAGKAHPRDGPGKEILSRSRG